MRPLRQLWRLKASNYLDLARENADNRTERKPLDVETAGSAVRLRV